jgi:hypothetical protein
MDRKGVYKSILMSVLILQCPIAWAQQNLVPNPSFEEYSDCPDNLGQLNLTEGWTGVLGSVDYYNVCGTNGYGIPANNGGYQESFEGGRGYAGVAIFGLGVSNFREYVGVQLIEVLQMDYKYDVSVRLSSADTAQFAVRNFGCAFTQTQPPNDISFLLAIQPQITYSDTSYLDDTLGWMTVEGSFIASGGEQFMTFGNFDSDVETDTLRVREDGLPVSYYYVDSVSVVKDTTYHVGIEEQADGEFGIGLYPNPNAGNFTVMLGMDETDRAEMTVWSITGQQVHTSTLSAGSNALRLNVAQGLYLYRVTVNGELKWTGKVSISPY